LIYGGYTCVRQAWVSDLDTIKENPSTIIDLHPQVFGSRPRIDLIHENVVWQKKYKYVVSNIFVVMFICFQKIKFE